MKTTRRIASLLLALVMVIAMAAPVWADEGDIYEIYQIFTGEYSEGILSNVKWGLNGTGYDEDAETQADVPDSVLKDLEGVVEATDVEQLKVIEKYADLTSTPIETGTATTYENLQNGYYLVKNVDGSQDGEGEFYTHYVVMVVDNTLTFNPKGEAPTLDKKITADDNDIDGDITEDGKYDNVSVGSTVTYTLTGTIPAYAANYDYYYYIINDTLSEGLTFDASSVKVYVGATAEEALKSTALEKGTDYYLYDSTDTDTTNNPDAGLTFEIAFANAKAYAGKVVVVTYNATLNENAVIGEVLGNPNTADLDYSNNPNYDYDGTQDEDKPGKPDSDKDKNVPIGDTPDSTTRTYTTGIKLIKVDENGDPLTGAQFTITGDNVVSVLVVDEVKYVEDANGTYWKLNDGTYTNEAPVTEAYYEEAAEGATAGYVRIDGEYVEYNADEHEGETVYIKVEANSDLYDSVDTMYKKVAASYRLQDQEDEVNGVAYVDEDGYLIFAGLGEGKYTITETVTPDGYNTIDPIEVTIVWGAPNTGSTDCEWTATATTVKGTLEPNAEGVFELTIVNESGSVLPETGGIGTTIFYVVGGLLVAAAVVLLVTKRRMGAAE